MQQLDWFAAVLGYILIISMLIRSLTLAVEAPLFHRMLRDRLSPGRAMFLTLFAVVLPALFSSPGWLMVSGINVLAPSSYEEIEEMVEELVAGEE